MCSLWIRGTSVLIETGVPVAALWNASPGLCEPRMWWSERRLGQARLGLHATWVSLAGSDWCLRLSFELRRWEADWSCPQGRKRRKGIREPLCCPVGGG